jgi:predicted transposase YbfD/YdcC
MQEQRDLQEQGLLSAFDELADPRSRACPHRFDELLLVALCGITSGADSWTDVALWATMKLDWLRRFLPFEAGIASHDTFSRVFNLLDSKKFEACFIAWMQQLCPSLKGRQICIDGKTVCGSHDGGAQAPIHLVSAWCSAAGVVLGQVKTQEKSTEVTAIPELLEALDMQGATITIDAVGCHRGLIDKIVSKGADYIVAVKHNQPTLATAVESMFEQSSAAPGKAGPRRHTTIDKGHGRIETRRCAVVHELSPIARQLKPWSGVRSVVMVESTRELPASRHKAASSSTERRYYISSVQLGAEQFNTRVRAHWSIENSCHWVLDMSFGEDACRIRTDHGAQNFAVLRRIALNLVKQEKSTKASVKARRKRAGWSTDYLQLLMGLNEFAAPAASSP